MHARRAATKRRGMPLAPRSIVKLLDAISWHPGFRVLYQSGTSQAAAMTLRPGETSRDDVGNEHAFAEQWLFVVSGHGVARVGDSEVELRPGALLLVERGEPHQIRCTGLDPLVTLDLYVPPAY